MRLKFFKSKDQVLLEKALLELEPEFACESTFREIKEVLWKDYKRDKKTYAKLIVGEEAAVIIALNTISNIAGDFLESGKGSFYRGVLDHRGKDALTIYKKAVGMLVERDEITQEFAQDQIRIIEKNIKNTG